MKKFLLLLAMLTTVPIVAQSPNSAARMMQAKYPEVYGCVSRDSNFDQSRINKQAEAFDIITDALVEYRNNEDVYSLISLALVNSGKKRSDFCGVDWQKALKLCKEYMPSRF
jgi:hypothetical protein